MKKPNPFAKKPVSPVSPGAKPAVGGKTFPAKKFAFKKKK